MSTLKEEINRNIDQYQLAGATSYTIFIEKKDNQRIFMTRLGLRALAECELNELLRIIRETLSSQNQHHYCPPYSHTIGLPMHYSRHDYCGHNGIFFYVRDRRNALASPWFQYERRYEFIRDSCAQSRHGTTTRRAAE